MLTVGNLAGQGIVGGIKKLFGDDDGAEGHFKQAGKVLYDYSEESLIGSGFTAAGRAIGGDLEGAERCGKGMGRALGQGICLGGLLSGVPGFKELSKAGKSLGDVIGGGDAESARKRWTEEWVQEYQDPAFVKHMLTDVVVTTAGVAIGVATMGTATVPAAIGIGAGIGGGGGAIGNAAHQGIDMLEGKRDTFDAGELVGGALGGAAVGAATAGVAKAIQNGANGGAQGGAQNWKFGEQAARARIQNGTMPDYNAPGA